METFKFICYLIASFCVGVSATALYFYGKFVKINGELAEIRRQVRSWRRRSL